MVTAVDSSVLLDVLTADRKFKAVSGQALHAASLLGRLIVCETVVAEITPALPAGDVKTFLQDCGLDYVAQTLESALLAGEHFRRYLARAAERGKQRVIADFLVAAHAKTQADRLLARDRGYYRDYFQDLVLVEPLLTAHRAVNACETRLRRGPRKTRFPRNSFRFFPSNEAVRFVDMDPLD